MMNCTLCKEQISDYLDFEINENLQAEMDYHLSFCQACKFYLDEMREVKELLQEGSNYKVPVDFSYNFVRNLNEAAKADHRVASFDLQFLFQSLLLRIQPKVAAYSTGIIVTLFLFIGILFSFKPLLHWTDSEYQVQYIKAQDLLPLSTVFATQDEFSSSLYTRPSITSDGGLGALPDALFISNNSDGRGLVFIAEVSNKGKAQLVQMVPPSNTPRMAAAVNAVLEKSSFQPAKQFGHPITSRVVLFMEQIYVRG